MFSQTHRFIMLTVGLLVITSLCLLCSCIQINVSPSSNSQNGNDNASSARQTSQTQTAQENANSFTPVSSHKIAKVTYSFNYAEVGDGLSYEIVRESSDEDTLTLTKIAYEKSAPNVFPCSKTVLDEIEKICDKHGVHKWQETLPPSDIQYADRSEKHISVEYTDGQVRNFSTDDALPVGGDEAISEIAALLDSTVEID